VARPRGAVPIGGRRKLARLRARRAQYDARSLGQFAGRTSGARRGRAAEVLVGGAAEAASDRIAFIAR